MDERFDGVSVHTQADDLGVCVLSNLGPAPSNKSPSSYHSACTLQSALMQILWLNTHDGGPR